MDEITAEYAAEALVQSKPLEVRLQLQVGAKTDLGRVRENNEDKFEFYIPEDEPTLARRGGVFVMCDGMGGHAAGQCASELAAKTFIDVYLNHPSEDPMPALDSAVKAANRFVLDVARAVPSRRGMGTTLTALVLLQDTAYFAHVGDSRLYRLRDRDLTMMTSDHTWVDEAIKRGEIPPEAADTHPYRHVLTRAIGTEDSVAVDVERHDVREGDVYLLCSDGLTNHVSDDQLKAAMAENGASEACWKLVGRALMDGGSDNCTVMVVKVEKMGRIMGLEPTTS